MPDEVLAPPEPKEIDEQRSIELPHGMTGVSDLREAFLRVRVRKEESNGYLAVYLPSGTALSVRVTDLLEVTSDADKAPRRAAGLRHHP